MLAILDERFGSECGAPRSFQGRQRALARRQMEAAALLAQLVTRLGGNRAWHCRGSRPPLRSQFVVDRQFGGLRGVVAGPGTYLDELVRRRRRQHLRRSESPLRQVVAVEVIEERQPEVIFDTVTARPLF